MDLLTTKILAMVIMGSVSLICGLLPLKVKPMILKGEENSRKRRRRERLISGLLCFGSGVLIATVFIHMLPETRAGFDKARQAGLLDFTGDHQNEPSALLNPDGHIYDSNHRHNGSDSSLDQNHDGSFDNHVHIHAHGHDHNHDHSHNNIHVHDHDHIHNIHDHDHDHMHNDSHVHDHDHIHNIHDHDHDHIHNDSHVHNHDHTHNDSYVHSHDHIHYGSYVHSHDHMHSDGHVHNHEHRHNYSYVHNHDHIHNDGHVHNHDHIHNDSYVHNHDHIHNDSHVHNHDHIPNDSHVHDHDHIHNDSHVHNHDHIHNDGHVHNHDHIHNDSYVHNHDHMHNDSHVHNHDHIHNDGHVHNHDHIHNDSYVHNHDHMHNDSHVHNHDHIHNDGHVHNHDHIHNDSYVHNHDHIHNDSHVHDHDHIPNDSHVHDHDQIHNDNHVHDHDHIHNDSHVHNQDRSNVHNHDHGTNRDKAKLVPQNQTSHNQSATRIDLTHADHDHVQDHAAHDHHLHDEVSASAHAGPTTIDHHNSENGKQNATEEIPPVHSDHLHDRLKHLHDEHDHFHEDEDHDEPHDHPHQMTESSHGRATEPNMEGNTTEAIGLLDFLYKQKEKKNENYTVPIKNDEALRQNTMNDESVQVNTISTLSVMNSPSSANSKLQNKSYSLKQKHDDNHGKHFSHSHATDPRFEAFTHEHHDHNHSEDDSHSYPVAELVICIGFALIYLVEETVHKVCLNHSKEPYDDSVPKKDRAHHHHIHTHVPKGHNQGSPQRTPSSENVISEIHPVTNGHPGTHQVIHKGMSPRSEWGVQGVDNPVFAGDVNASGWNPKVRSTLFSSAKVLPITTTDPSQYMNGVPHHSRSPSVSIVESPSQDDSKKPSAWNAIASNLRSLLVVVALAFHAVFEGLAMGLQEQQKDVWYLFFAICAHKFVIMFCIGLELMEDKTSRLQMVLSMIILALVSPFGALIGLIVTENAGFGGTEHILIVAILQGLAAGTLLYVAFLEVLERERSKPGGRLLKLFCLIVGFTLMSSLEAIGGHSH